MQTQALVEEAVPSRTLPPRNARPPLTLRANFAWTFVGNVIYSGCQWGMLVVLARLGDAEMVGRFALGLAITAPVFMFSNLQLRAVQATDARQEYLFGDYLTARLLMSAAALLVVAGVVALSGYGVEVAGIILAVAAAKACESVSDIVYGLLQQHERMDRLGISLMLRGPAALVALGTAVWLTHRLLWGVLSMAAVWAVVLMVFDCRSAVLLGGEVRDGRAGLRPRFQPAVLGRLLWLALPLGVVTCLLSLNTSIPRYFVEHHLGLRALGVFSAIGYLIVAGNTIVTALAQSAVPRLASHYAVGERRQLRSLLGRLCGLGILLGGVGVLAAWLAGSDILRLIYGPDYAEWTELFVLLMIAAGTSYVASFIGYAVTAARYYRVQAPVFVIVCLITTAASAWLVPKEGLCGAAWAVLLTMLCQLVLLAAVATHAYIRMPERRR